MGMRLDGNNHACGVQNRNHFRRFPLGFRLKVGKLVGNVDTWLETVENTDKFDSGCACATVLSLCTILPECQEQFIQLVTIFYLKPFHYPF